MGDEPTPFSLDPEDENEGGDVMPSGSDNKTIQEIRAFAERAEKRAAAAEKKAEEYQSKLGEYVAKEQDAAITSVFKEVGLNEAHGELFKTVNKDLEVSSITADAVKEFANKYQLPVSETGEPPEAPERKPGGFTPPPVSGVPVPVDKLTIGDIDKLLASGESAEVEKAFRDGRVEEVEAPWPMDPGRRRA